MLGQQTLVWGGETMSEHTMLPNAITGECVSDDPALRAVFLKEFHGKADMLAEKYDKGCSCLEIPW
jgi:hypothetical protein